MKIYADVDRAWTWTLTTERVGRYDDVYEVDDETAARWLAAQQAWDKVIDEIDAIDRERREAHAEAIRRGATSTGGSPAYDPTARPSMSGGQAVPPGQKTVPVL